MVRDSGHVIALDTAAMATATTGRPTAARNASHPELRRKPLPPNYSGSRQHPASDQPARHQPISPSSIYPPTSGPPRKGPCNDPHDPHPENHHPHHRRESPSAAASRYQQLRSHLAELKLTPPPKPCHRSWTRPPRRACR